jgi:catalase
LPIPTSCAPLKTDIRDGNQIEARHAINGGPSVLYDAVALLTSEKAMLRLIADSATRDFISDAFAHSKFIAYAESAERLITAVIGDNNLDRGFIQIKTTDDAALFVKACRKLRFWGRKSQVQVKEQVQNAHAM